MATNEVFEYGRKLSVVCTDPATPASGDPVLYGQRPGVALTDENTTTGETSVQFDGVWDLSVKGIDGGGNSAVAKGDILYYVAADTPKLSKKTTGVRFGYANETVTSGATATIQVIVGY
jgi:predicted RecA/RadA family phage recombinase